MICSRTYYLHACTHIQYITHMWTYIHIYVHILEYIYIYIDHLYRISNCKAYIDIIRWVDLKASLSEWAQMKNLNNNYYYIIYIYIYIYIHI